MAYQVHVSDRDIAYLADLPLSDRAKERVYAFIESDIANVEDDFRIDPLNRHSAQCFRIQLLLLDFWGDRRPHLIDFVVNDENAKYGVLLVAYVEHQ